MEPDSSSMAEGHSPPVANTCPEDTQPKRNEKKTKSKISFFRRKLRKAPPVRKPRPERFREDAMKAQVEKIMLTIFVSSCCLCCPSQTQLGKPRLCPNRTYNCFNPDLDTFMRLYGSDGSQVYWKMIIEDIQRYICVMQMSDDSAPNKEATVLTWSQVLQQAEEKLRCAIVPSGRYNLPLPTGTLRGSCTQIWVPAPDGSCSSRKRIIWVRIMSSGSPKERSRDPRSQTTKKTQEIDINGIPLKKHARPFDQQYLRKRDLRGCRKFCERAAGISRGWGSGKSPGFPPTQPRRKPSPLSQSTIAEWPDHPT